MRATLQRFAQLNIVAVCGLSRTVAPAPMEQHQLYINGEFVQPASDAVLDVIDPSTAEVIAPSAGCRTP